KKTETMLSSRQPCCLSLLSKMTHASAADLVQLLLAVGTCEIVMLNRDSSVPRRTIARQTARCACRRGQIAGTTRARPACVDARIVRSRQWCEMIPCLEGEVCSLLFNRSGWTCTRGSGRIKTVTVIYKTWCLIHSLCTQCHNTGIFILDYPLQADTVDSSTSVKEKSNTRSVAVFSGCISDESQRAYRIMSIYIVDSLKFTASHLIALLYY
uniref:TAFA chemokine like family member 5, like n=1 Tax=Mastacembelus armatus TaxID=205130 RepID=A0A7N8WNP8_9TELE